jgi:hypothetical protein
MDDPEPPAESAALRFGRAAEERCLEGARWAGRGDESRGLSSIALAAAGGAFVCLFLPWLGFDGHEQAGWNIPLGTDYGLLALAVVLVELLALARAWNSRGSECLTFSLVAAASVIGLSAFANLRWDGLLSGSLVQFEYGSWIGLVLALVLLVLAALRLAALRRSAP